MGSYICKVICCSFQGDGIGTHVHIYEMLFPDVLNSIQYRGLSFRPCPLFPIQTGPNSCYRFIIYISSVLKFVGASGCEWWLYWGVRGRLPSSCCWWGSVGGFSVHQV